MDGLGRTCLLIKKANLHSGCFDFHHHNEDYNFNKHHLSLTSLIRFLGRRLFMAATYSPDLSVPLAQLCLTSLFGMGRGGTTVLQPPIVFKRFMDSSMRLHFLLFAFGRLSFICQCVYRNYQFGHLVKCQHHNSLHCNNMPYSPSGRICC